MKVGLDKLVVEYSPVKNCILSRNSYLKVTMS